MIPQHSSVSPSLDAPAGHTTTTTTAPCPTSLNTPSQTTVPVQYGSKHPAQLATSTRYALSRFPFPLLIIRFNTLSAKTSVKKIQDELVAHGNSALHAKISFLHGRASNVRCDLNEVDILLYVKDVTSFALLLDHANWPPVLAGEMFSLPSPPSCPPQLAIIIRNVDMSVDLAELTVELKEGYPSTRNVIRLKNKFGNDTNLLKVDLASPAERQSIIDAKRISLNHMQYVVGEYLAPASVLICSKCCGLGHFREQCEDQHDTCKKCGQSCADIKVHNCSAPPGVQTLQRRPSLEFSEMPSDPLLQSRAYAQTTQEKRFTQHSHRSLKLVESRWPAFQSRRGSFEFACGSLLVADGQLSGCFDVLKVRLSHQRSSQRSSHIVESVRVERATRSLSG